MKGEIKFFNFTKGFGFITVTGQKDVFFHKSGIYGRTELQEGDYVEFDVSQSARGPQAENIRLC